MVAESSIAIQICSNLFKKREENKVTKTQRTAFDEVVFKKCEDFWTHINGENKMNVAYHINTIM